MNQAAAPTSTTTNYFYDLKGHLIAEMNPTGTATLREYFWLDDIPVAVVDWVSNASPTVYYVHVDHLMRPIRMTDVSGNIAWDVTYSPFGATTSITQNPEVMNGRFFCCHDGGQSVSPALCLEPCAPVPRHMTGPAGSAPRTLEKDHGSPAVLALGLRLARCLVSRGRRGGAFAFRVSNVWGSQSPSTTGARCLAAAFWR